MKSATANCGLGVADHIIADHMKVGLDVEVELAFDRFADGEVCRRRHGARYQAGLTLTALRPRSHHAWFRLSPPIRLQLEGIGPGDALRFPAPGVRYVDILLYPIAVGVRDVQRLGNFVIDRHGLDAGRIEVALGFA